MYFLFTIGAFLTLFLVSRLVTIQLGNTLMRLTRSHTRAIQLLALLFFPGVLIHELGHFLMASLLFVPTGEIEFLPKVQEGGVKLGSVAIAKTDPFRRLLIGVAPVLGGIGIMLLAVYYLVPLWPLSWHTYVFVYVLFEIGNTMFSSKKDLEGALGLVVFLGFLLGCLFILGARVPIQVTLFLQHVAALPIFLQISKWVFFAVGIDMFVWILLKGVERIR